ncbi:uncharacterized protein LOC129610371 [Condylostylus longicornis]|uniref:uncharacterized protein LOC129610371 n=1 Tax=Condylostylus longicornis TaxID=2530218 RepID=UPI00244E28C4|nr:uncharacterized protein LOC129610371 [Condylostylus longicornis]
MPEIYSLCYFISSAFTAPATVLQQPLLLQSPQLLRIAPDLAIVDRPLPYSFYQTYPYGNVYLLRQQGIGDGGQFADQVQDYFGMFGGQLMEFQNQTSGIFQDVQSNIQSSFGQGFELVSQGFEQGFDQVSQGWGDLQQQWGGGLIKTNNQLMSSNSVNDGLRSDKNENDKAQPMKQAQPNLLYKPIALKYSSTRFIPLNLVRYNLIPLNYLQQPLKQQEKEQLQQPPLQGRASDEKSEKEEPAKAGESSQ